MNKPSNSQSRSVIAVLWKNTIDMTYSCYVAWHQASCSGHSAVYNQRIWILNEVKRTIFSSVTEEEVLYLHARPQHAVSCHKARILCLKRYLQQAKKLLTPS